MKRSPLLLWAIVMAALVLVPGVASADPCRACNDSCDFTLFLGSPVCGVEVGSCAFCAVWNEGHVLSSGVRARGPRFIDRLDSGRRKESGLIGV